MPNGTSERSALIEHCGVGGSVRKGTLYPISFQIFMRARGTRFVATVAATTLKPRIASSSPTLTGESPESGR